MASIKLKFRTSSVQEKEGRLYYQVIHNRVARQIHTEYRIYSSEWDADHSNIILPTSVTPQRQAYLLSLKDTLDADRKKLLLVIARLDKEGQSYTADTVVDNFHEGKELHGIIGYTLELNEKTETHRQEADGSKVQNHPQQPPALPERRRCAIGGSRWDNDTRL